MQDEVRLGLLKKSGKTESGYVICGYKWIFAEGSFVSYDTDPVWNLDDISWIVDKKMSGRLLGGQLIYFSPFEDSKGRPLKEGDIVKPDHEKLCPSDFYQGRNGIIVQESEGYGGWDITWNDSEAKSTLSNLCPYIEYTGNIYEEK